LYLSGDSRPEHPPFPYDPTDSVSPCHLWGDPRRFTLKRGSAFREAHLVKSLAAARRNSVASNVE
jgi:hypothetical protein